MMHAVRTCGITLLGCMQLGHATWDDIAGQHARMSPFDTVKATRH